MAANNIATLKTLQRKSDGWDDIITQLGKAHNMLMIDNLQPVSDIIQSYNKTLFYSLETVVHGSNTVRNLTVFDKNKNVLRVCENLELINDKLYLRTPYVAPKSWFNLFGLFRAPNVNVNVKRK